MVPAEGFMEIGQSVSRYQPEQQILKLKEWARYFFHRSNTSNVEFKSIDGLRGFAILIIIASHTNAFHFFEQGGIGVWLFFGLSGFLLSVPYAQNPSRIRSRRDVVRFYKRRLFRICPLYYLLISFFFVIGRFSFATYLRHLSFLQGDGVLWIIPQVMLFYLFFPFFVWINYYMFRGNKQVIIIAWSIASAVLIAMRDNFPIHLNGNGRLSPFYLDIFLWGAVFCYCYHEANIKELCQKKTLKPILRCFGIAIILFFIFSSQYYAQSIGQLFLGKKVLIPSAWEHLAFYGFLSGLLIFIVVAYQEGMPSACARLSLLRMIGIVSYGIYLFHVPIMRGLIKIGVAEGSVLFVCTVAITTIVALVTFRLIEQPINELSHNKSEQGTGGFSKLLLSRIRMRNFLLTK